MVAAARDPVLRPPLIPSEKDNAAPRARRSPLVTPPPPRHRRRRRPPPPVVASPLLFSRQRPPPGRLPPRGPTLSTVPAPPPPMAARPPPARPSAPPLAASLSPSRANPGSFDGGEFSASSDTDSVSSGSNSGVQESRPKALPRGISVPARFWQETNSRLRRLPQPGTPLSSSPVSRTPIVPPNLANAKRSLVDSPLSSPRTVSSPLRGPARPSSPSKLAASPSSRGIASPLKTRGSVVAGSNVILQHSGNAPSILSFSAEVRRAKKGENRIEEAHMLRLFHNRQLQWRWVNARAGAALLLQRLTAEKNVFNAWITISGLRDSLTLKRIKLHLLRQNVKLISILKGQMAYLEDWSLLDREHSSSLSGAIEALKASTLRLPIVGGARADIQEVKDAVGSAVDIMQSMGSSICSLLSKVEGTSSLVSELAKVAAQEQALLDQSKDLLSTIAAMHVKQCSLRGHIIQLNCKPSRLLL